MNTTPPTDCPAWKKLAARARAAPAPSPEARLAQGPGMTLDYARQRVDGEIVALLAQLAAERGFAEWRRALFAGEKINTTEDRAVTHFALRAPDAPGLKEMLSLSGRIREQKRYSRVINLGTGGSDLGPRLLADAFADVKANGGLDVRFVANVDRVELDRATAGADAKRTLVVVASKTFTTQETMANALELKRRGYADFIAATANPAAAKSFGAAEVLEFPDSVGGRYSVWSAAGFAGLLAVGGAAYAEFLAGGREMDEHFRTAPPESSLPALMGLLGAWNVNFLGLGAHAVLPYAHRLRLLPAYLQQLEMESNGKGVDREGRPVGYATCPVIFGAEGTNSQHAFMQLLHQGPQAIAADFIDAAVNDTLSANARAQADALARGTTDAALPPYRRHAGGRPSSLLRFAGLGPRDLGRLIALYEHKVFTQGVLWNINSFDQWGVELGKQLASQLLVGSQLDSDRKGR
jgi:glucose-6-phosphate isomerase